MRIVHIINSLNTGGAEKLVLETIPEYRKKGLMVDVVLLDGTEHPFVKQLKSNNDITLFSLGVGGIYNPWNIFKLRKYLKNYDIAHVHLFPALYFVVFAKVLSNAKISLVYTEHSTSNRRLKNTIFSFIDKHIYRFYHRIICITEEIRHIIQNHTGLNSKRVKVIENGVDISRFHNALPLERHKIDKRLIASDLVLIQVARFNQPKDQKTVIRSLTRLPQNVKLLLIGDGELKNECEALVGQLQLKSRVFFLGLRMDVPQLLKMADIVILSSFHEGLSLSSIEGMAAGKPFVATNVPGLTDVVKGAGVLFEPKDEKGLANEINKLIDDSLYYNEIAAACLKRSEQYDLKKMVEQHIKLYEACLRKN
ncbi:glycosyltransferase [Candidatus Ulvibacter alkanivorans]|uniref:glycosyltransferase n=1 Tax=Candidatus Ulvibacter alkanivorans TaxID=2267620 RepID=UPI000DF460D3|nr:glycosyltransferase [Candidatus Ulvibacter alkanivorans]